MNTRRGYPMRKKKKRNRNKISSYIRVCIFLFFLCIFSYLIFEVFDTNKNKKNGLTAGGGLRASNKFKSSDSIDNSLQNAEVVDPILNAALVKRMNEHNNINNDNIHENYNVNNDDNDDNNNNNNNYGDIHILNQDNNNYEKQEDNDVIESNKLEQSRVPTTSDNTKQTLSINNNNNNNNIPEPPPEQIAKNAHRGCNLLPISRCKMENPGIVILSHNRVEYVKKTIQSLLGMPEVLNYKVYVSIDDPNSFDVIENAIREIMESYQNSHPNFHIKTWKKSDVMTGHRWYNSALSKIAQHFKFVLNKGFMEMMHSHLIMIEDDLLLGKDFLQLFEETAWLIEAEPDKTYCVSAWNDNGLKGVVRQTDEGKSNLLRTGYFPGLGWMTTRDVWVDLRDRWPDKPTTGWDHWLRLSTSMNGKECIYPEIPRTKHVSTHGTNVNSQSAIAKFEKYAFVNDIIAETQSEKDVNVGTTKFINTQDLLYSNYQAKMKARVLNAHRVNHVSQIESNRYHLQASGTESLAFLILYKREDYEFLAERVGLPRTQARGWHKGIVQTFLRETSKYKGKQLFLADKRTAEYIHEHEKIKPNPNMKVIGANRGEDCSTACRRRNLRCKEDDLAFVNDCGKFKDIFKCENGCGHQVGAEIPCYVAAVTEPTYRQCLISDSGRNNCGAKHHATQRLCACS